MGLQGGETKLVRAFGGHPLGAIDAGLGQRLVEAVKRTDPDEPLQVVALGLVEVEVGRSEEAVALGAELGGRAGRNHAEAVCLRELGIGVMKLRIHVDLIEPELLETSVPRRIAPGLLHDDLGLRRQFADRLDEVVTPGVVRRLVPALVAALLEGDDVPVVHRQRIGNVRRAPLNQTLAFGDAIEAIGLDGRVRLRDLDILPMALKRTAADVERRHVELAVVGLGDLRRLTQTADREAVPNHQHLQGFINTLDRLLGLLCKTRRNDQSCHRETNS